MPYTKSNEPPIPLSVIFKRSTAEKIRKIALASNKSAHDTILFLVNTAIKYNYTKDFRYIPCKPRTDEDFTLPKKESSCKINLLISHSLNKKLENIMSLNLCGSKSAAIRSLVETALLYDYDKNLFFHAPQKLSASNSSQNKTSNDIIMLDII